MTKQINQQKLKIMRFPILFIIMGLLILWAIYMKDAMNTHIDMIYAAIMAEVCLLIGFIVDILTQKHKP
jgi:hypothetical protein